MGKQNDVDFEQIKDLMQQINEKISNAKVLNGAFDKLELEVTKIKELQKKLNLEFESRKINEERMEQKIDRLYDPENGIYAKVQKTEMLLETLNNQISGLVVVDEKLQRKISSIEEKAISTEKTIEDIKKITGENHIDLIKSIKLSKGFFWVLVTVGAGLLSAVGKFLWELFIG